MRESGLEQSLTVDEICLQLARHFTLTPLWYHEKSTLTVPWSQFDPIVKKRTALPE
jgi:hypothetical protein